MSGYLVIQFGGQNVLSGGLGDRFVGLVSAVLLAKKLGKTLKIQWLSPSLVGVLRIQPDLVYSGPAAHSSSPKIDAMDHRGLQRFPNLFRTEAARWRQLKIPLFLRCNQILFPDETQAAAEIYTRIFSDYFIPLIKDWKPHNPNYVAVQLRTGDTYMQVGETKMCDNVTKTLEYLAQIVHERFAAVPAIFFSTDHPTAKITFRKLLTGYNKVMLEVPGSENFHLERYIFYRSPQHNKTGILVRDLMMLISAAEGLIISGYSNYGKLAAHMRHQPQTTWRLEKNTYHVTWDGDESRNCPIGSSFSTPSETPSADASLALFKFPRQQQQQP